MSSEEIYFSFIYFFIVLCFIVPPRELISAGLTVQNLFSSYLGSEDVDFIGYHLKRTTITLGIHSCFPIGSYVYVFKKLYMHGQNVQFIIIIKITIGRNFRVRENIAN